MIYGKLFAVQPIHRCTGAIMVSHEGYVIMSKVLHIQLARSEDIPVIDLTGDVDSFTAKDLQQAIIDLIEKGETRIIVNVSKVKYIDSSGLGTLIGGLRRVMEVKGRMAIVGPNPHLEKILEITGLNRVIALYADTESAARSVLS
jgi:anti-sigma B factor antagonist